jgi:hypothetical protein
MKGIKVMYLKIPYVSDSYTLERAATPRGQYRAVGTAGIA